MPSNKTSDATVQPIPADEVASIIAEQEAKQAPLREELAHGTVRETNTVYEDRTVNPAAERDVDYEVEHVDLGNGTILTNVGEVRA